MESKILHAGEGFRLLKSVFRLKLKRASRDLCRRWSSERVKFPVGVVLDNVDFFIANVEVRVAFSFAFLENNYFGFHKIYF